MDYERLLTIGDIHGHFTKFMTLFNKLDFTDKDLLILLGDLVSGDDENIEMLNWAVENVTKENVIILCGNAENDLLKRLKNFERKGKTAKALFNSGNPALIQKVQNFIEHLPTHYSLSVGDRKFYWCHAGIDPSKPFNEQSRTTLLETRPKKFAQNYNSDVLLVVGHTRTQKYFGDSQTKPKRIPDKNILLMDTGAKKGGPISCCEVLTNKIWQSDF